MRILQIIQKKQLRGAEVFACQLSNELVGMGHEVKMLALLDGDASMPFNDEVDILHVNLSRRMWDYKAWKKLAIIINSYKPDIVQANAGDTLKYASMSKRLFGWKSKLVFRNANKMGDFIDAKWKHIYNKWLLDPVEFVASVSSECEDDFTQTFDWPGKKIKTLPIGVGGYVRTNVNPLAESGYQDRYPVLLSVAGFVKEKNHAGLINIIEQLKNDFPGLLLIMIGEGKLQPAIKELSISKELGDNVWFAGRRNDVQAFMQHAHALVMPSLIEGLPGVILEAFVNGLPVVAYNVGGISEVVKNDNTGWLIPKDDEVAFAKAVVELLNLQDQSLNSIKANASELVQLGYDNKVIAKKFEQSYLNLINQTKALYA